MISTNFVQFFSSHCEVHSFNTVGNKFILITGEMSVSGSNQSWAEHCQHRENSLTKKTATFTFIQNPFRFRPCLKNLFQALINLEQNIANLERSLSVQQFERAEQGRTRRWQHRLHRPHPSSSVIQYRYPQRAKQERKRIYSNFSKMPHWSPSHHHWHPHLYPCLRCRRSSGGSVASMETTESQKGLGRRYFITHEKMLKKR